MKPKIREAVTHLMAERPLKDEPTREFLRREGFDLLAPITWFDNATTTLRHFRQDEKWGLQIPVAGGT